MRKKRTPQGTKSTTPEHGTILLPLDGLSKWMDASGNEHTIVADVLNGTIPLTRVAAAYKLPSGGILRLRHTIRCLGSDYRCLARAALVTGKTSAEVNRLCRARRTGWSF